MAGSINSANLIIHNFQIKIMLKKIAFWLLVAFYLFAGANHFMNPEFYNGMIPPYLPWHGLINIASGVAEIGLALLLLVPSLRSKAAIGIIVLLIAFIPAHIYHIQMKGCLTGQPCIPEWATWLRLLVFQPIFIIWAWWCRK